MRIGIDIDGVLADFNTSFIARVIAVTERDLFPPRPFDIPTWDYPQHYGYTEEETARVWESIKADPTFWLSLAPYWDAMTVLERLRILSADHDVYFITSRPGIKTKQQSEVWLATHSGNFLWNPTVLISSGKGACARALRLDAYIDDYDHNVHDVLNETGCAVWAFLLDRPWNRQYVGSATRVESVTDMLDQLALDLSRAA